MRGQEARHRGKANQGHSQQDRRMDGIVLRRGRYHPVERRAQDDTRQKSAADAECGREQDHPRYVAALRAQCHTYPELVGPLCHAVGHHAVPRK